MPHVVLLGDSVFDNAAYTKGQPDVISQVRGELPSGWQATLSAVDGSTTEDISEQLRSLPEHATHLVISIGGNNALLHEDILDRQVKSSGEAFVLLAEVAGEFEMRTAVENELTVLDLRFICSEPRDFANPIEPSSIGGAKIARAVVRAVTPSGARSRGTRVITT